MTPEVRAAYERVENELAVQAEGDEQPDQFAKDLATLLAALAVQGEDLAMWQHNFARLEDHIQDRNGEIVALRGDLTTAQRDARVAHDWYRAQLRDGSERLEMVEQERDAARGQAARAEELFATCTEAANDTGRRLEEAMGLVRELREFLRFEVGQVGTGKIRTSDMLAKRLSFEDVAGC